MALDEFGKIAAAEIAFYVPVLCIAFFIALKHGFSRRAGWVFLFTFSLVRVIGAAITVASKTTSNPQTGLIIAATVLQGIGLSPLLLATQGFVTAIAHYGLPMSTRSLHLTRLLLLAGLVLGAAGGSMLSPDNSPSDISTGRTLTRAAVVIFMVAYLILFALHIMLWGVRNNTPVHHRSLLTGVSLALPPLFVRIVYGLLSAFASSTRSRWSSISGDWKIYLTMGLVMEYLVVVTYVTTGALTPLHRDEAAEARGEIEMGKRTGRVIEA